jgi:hypothetical protein
MYNEIRKHFISFEENYFFWYDIFCLLELYFKAKVKELALVVNIQLECN